MFKFNISLDDLIVDVICIICYSCVVIHAVYTSINEKVHHKIDNKHKKIEPNK